MREKLGKRNAPVTGKRVELSRCRGDIANCGTELEDHDEDNHGSSTTDGASGIQEHLNERKAGRGFDGLLDISNTESIGHDHDKPGDTVQDQSPNHSQRQYARRILDFLRCNSTVKIRLKAGTQGNHTHMHSTVGA